MEAPLLLLAKSAKGIEALDPRFAYLLRLGDRVLIWAHSQQCIELSRALAAAEVLARQLATVGVCSKAAPERVEAGQESAEFVTAVFGDEVTVAPVQTLVEHDMDAELLAGALRHGAAGSGGAALPEGSSAPGTPGVSSGAATARDTTEAPSLRRSGGGDESVDSQESEPTKDTSSSAFSPFLLTYPDLEELNMFDTGDLEDDGLFVLVDSQGNVRLWVGQDAELEGRDAEEIAEEATQRVLQLYSGRVASHPDVRVELQGDETEEFFDQFING